MIAPPLLQGTWAKVSVFFYILAVVDVVCMEDAAGHHRKFY